MMRRSTVLFFLFLGVLTSLVLIGVSQEKERAQDQPDIILITLESARADNFACYGYERNTTPDICELAEDGVLFEKAYSQGTNTPSSVPAILTSEMPSEVGSGEWGRDLPESSKTMAEILNNRGYSTKANLHVGHYVDWYQGFKGIYHTDYLTGQVTPLIPLNFSISREIDVMKEGPEFMNRLLEDDPAFVWHFTRKNVHTPYYPEIEDKKWSKIDFPENKSQKSEFEWFKDLEYDKQENFYDDELRTTDRKIGEIIKSLKSNGRYEESLIIITSDHGEALGRHNISYHGGPPYEHQIHIPLIIKFPENKFSNTKITQPVRLIDIAPTIYDYLNIEDTESEGASLIPLLRDDSYDQTVFAMGFQIEDKSEKIWAIRTENYKYTLRNPKLQCKDQEYSSEELYNIQNDSLEKENIVRERPELRAKLRTELCDLILEDGEKNNSESYEVTEESLREQLEDLGYIKN